MSWVFYVYWHYCTSATGARLEGTACWSQGAFCKRIYEETSSQWGWMKEGPINLSLIEIVQMEAGGSPMLGAVQQDVNYSPASLCGSVALSCQSLTCSSGVFHFKTSILLRSRSNRTQGRGYCESQWFITTSTASILFLFFSHSPLFFLFLPLSLTHTFTLLLSHMVTETQ